VDDFAAARNHALAASEADWNLVLDADEWISSGRQALAALRRDAPEFVGAIRVDSAFDAVGQAACASSWLSRVLPRGVRYQGRIHEQPVHALPLRRLDIYVGHDGYRPQALAAKHGRNAALLQAALAQAPEDAYLHYQSGKDHAVYDRYAQAADCFAQAAARLPGEPPWAHDLLVRWIFALKRSGRHEEAVTLAEAHMARWSESPDYWFALGDLLLDWGCAASERAGELVPMIEASWQRCLEIGERPDLEGAVHGRGTVLAASNLAVLCDGLGRADEASAYRAQAVALASGAGRTRRRVGDPVVAPADPTGPR
jgi:tetratricopeptide (TPR) repeat protein